SSGPSWVIGGLSGIVLAFLMRQKRQLAIFFLVLLSAFTVNTLSARMWNNSRYSIILGLFLIPYAWFFVDRALAFLGLRRIIFFILSLIFLTVDFVQTAQKSVSQTTAMICMTPPEIINIATWLKNHVRADEFLIIEGDPCNVWQNNIVLRSRLSPKRCMVISMPVGGKSFFENKEGFERYILTHRTRYLVLNSESDLQKVLNFKLDQKKQRLGDISFEVVFEQDVFGYGKYLIYRISY
ncbi:MAG: hypothetical protein WC530_09795, partial [Candidatus Omnitrophota bacterium]